MVWHEGSTGEDIFSQDPYQVRFEWGPDGAERAADRGDMVVIVDTLSFSSTVATAVMNGAIIYPLPPGQKAEDAAAKYSAEIAVRRREVPHKGRFSLSPKTMEQATAGQKIILPSPNGANCTGRASKAPVLVAASLVNSRATGVWIRGQLSDRGIAVTVIAAGERWPESGLGTRFAIEDYLGAGAIIAEINGDNSPEAEICRNAFTASQKNIAEIIFDCVSGRELRQMGFGGDVNYCAQKDIISVVPLLINNGYQTAEI